MERSSERSFFMVVKFVKEKQIAMKAAKKAGKMLLKEFKKPSLSKTMRKSRHEIVTPADFAAEKIILDLIKENFPEHDILSEEAGFQDKKNVDYLWVVDPLDGTTNFAMKNPIFSVSIGLIYKGEPVMGVVYAPVTEEMFVAEKGKGAYLNKKKIRVSGQKKLSLSLVTFCHGEKPHHLKKIASAYKKLRSIPHDLRQLGSAALAMAFVAAGRTECLFIHRVKLWDMTAGVVLVREAGGKVTDFSGREWNINSPDILATNGEITKELIRYL